MPRLEEMGSVTDELMTPDFVHDPYSSLTDDREDERGGEDSDTLKYRSVETGVSI